MLRCSPCVENSILSGMDHAPIEIEREPHCQCQSNGTAMDTGQFAR